MTRPTKLATCFDSASKGQVIELSKAGPAKGANVLVLRKGHLFQILGKPTGYSRKTLMQELGVNNRSYALVRSAHPDETVTPPAAPPVADPPPTQAPADAGAGTAAPDPAPQPPPAEGEPDTSGAGAAPELASEQLASVAAQTPAEAAIGDLEDGNVFRLPDGRFVMTSNQEPRFRVVNDKFEETGEIIERDDLAKLFEHEGTPYQSYDEIVQIKVPLVVLVQPPKAAAAESAPASETPTGPVATSRGDKFEIGNVFRLPDGRLMMVTEPGGQKEFRFVDENHDFTTDEPMDFGGLLDLIQMTADDFGSHEFELHFHVIE